MAQNLLTYPQARTELLYRLGNRSDLGAEGTTADRAALWLDMAQIRMASAVIAMETLDVTWPLTTVQYQSEYSENSIFPPMTNVIGIKQIRNDTTGVYMWRFPWSEYRSLNQQAQGPPMRWARYGTTIAFDPQPDNNGPYDLLIDYRRQPQRGTVEIPARYQQDWLSVAEWIAWVALMKVDRATAALQMMPAQVRNLCQTPLDRDQWEAQADPHLVVAPVGFAWPYINV